eukprot:g6827.t1
MPTKKPFAELREHMQRRRKNEALNSIRRQFLENKHRASLKAIFLRMDRDKNGTVDQDEFERALKSIGIVLDWQVLEPLFYLYDSDASQVFEKRGPEILQQIVA